MGTLPWKVEIPLKDVIAKKYDMDREIREATERFSVETGLRVETITVSWQRVDEIGYRPIVVTEVKL